MRDGNIYIPGGDTSNKVSQLFVEFKSRRDIIITRSSQPPKNISKTFHQNSGHLFFIFDVVAKMR
jgi:hypothetical protein